MLKRDFSDIVYRALANYFDGQVINSNIKRQGRKILYIDANPYVTIPAGNSIVVQITPPAGKIWRVVTLWLKAQGISGATTGDHLFLVYNFSKEWMGLLIKGNYNATIDTSNNSPSGYSVLKPNDVVAWNLAMRNIFGSNSHPICVKYVNNTDADQTNLSDLRLIVEEYDEVS